jgi:N utilization substance protein B
MWELFHTDMPTSIVINEAVELAKCFSEKDAYKFVNGILDEAVKEKESQTK